MPVRRDEAFDKASQRRRAERVLNGGHDGVVDLPCLVVDACELWLFRQWRTGASAHIGGRYSICHDV